MSYEQLTFRTRSVLEKYDLKKVDIFRSTRRNDSFLKSVCLMVELKTKISLLEFMGIQHELEDVLGIKVGLFEYDALRSALQKGAINVEQRIV